MRHLIFLIALLLSPSLSAAEQTVPLGKNPVMAGGIFSPGGGGVTVAAELRKTVDGQMAVCGVWARSARLNIYARNGARNTLVPATLRVDGKEVRRDLRVFPQVSAAASYSGAHARCVATGLGWRDGARLEISIPRQAVSRDRSGAGGGVGPNLVLNRTDEANPALRSGSVVPEGLKGVIPGLGG